MDSKVADLKKQLAEAEKAAKEKDFQDIVSWYERERAGRTFVSVAENHSGVQSAYIAHFLAETTVNSFFEGKALQVCRLTLGVALDPKKRRKIPKFRMEEIARNSHQIELRDFGSAISSLGNVGKEVSSEGFFDIWHSFDAPASRIKASIESIFGPIYRYDSREKEIDAPIDLEYVELEPWEYNMLQSSPFFLKGSKYLYLVTPNSRAEARRILQESETQDSRVLPISEACDSAYFDGNTRTRQSIRAKLKL